MSWGGFRWCCLHANGSMRYSRQPLRYPLGKRVVVIVAHQQGCVYIAYLPAQLFLRQTYVQWHEYRPQACQGVNEGNVRRTIGGQQRHALASTHVEGGESPGELVGPLVKLAKAPLSALPL